jgi:hypothetical protein
MLFLFWTAASGLTLVLAGGWIGLGCLEKHDSAEKPVWQVGVPVAVAVHDGRATFRVATPEASSEILVVVSALARSRGPFPIELSAKPADCPSLPALADDGPVGHPRSTRTSPPPALVCEPARAFPPRERVFHMMVRDGDVVSPSNYTAIRGVLKGLGRSIQVYVAAEDLDQVDDELLNDIVVTFDDRIFPETCRRFGAASDVDGDGRFTIFLSSWLNHLGGGRYAVDGFVRVADLDAAFQSPFGNHCDMMYLSTDLKKGPHLRTVLAHEYMHAVIFSQKRLQGKSGAGPGMEEEGWLDEAMAHLAEDLHGFSTSNIDYRVSAFLAWPERYQLLVDDYYAADLFRSHGNRGSTYLFLRWCADRYGPDLLTALVHSPLRGVVNLETATGSTFAGLYRRWSLALYQTAQEPRDSEPEPAGGGIIRGHMRSRHEESELAGPRSARLVCGGRAHRWAALGSSSHFVIVDGSTSGAVEIAVAGPTEAELQVTALPIGADRARLELSVSKIQGAGGELCLRAQVKERRGIPVRLMTVSWEPLTPPPHRHSGGSACGRLDHSGIAAAFGTRELPASGELGSRPIPLPGVSRRTGPMVVKVIGTDAKGRCVVAWADLDPESGAPSRGLEDAPAGALRTTPP